MTALSIENKSPQEQEEVLAEDPSWFAGMVKLQAPYMFIDLAGYLLFRKFGEDFYEKVDRILKKTDLNEVVTSLNYQTIRDDHVRQNYKKSSFFLLTYSLFSEIIDQMVISGWLAQYKNATAKRSLVLSDQTRKVIFSYVEQWDGLISNGRDLMKPWSLYCTELQDLTNGIVNIDD